MHHTTHQKKKFWRELSVDIVFLYKSKAFLCLFFKIVLFIYLLSLAALRFCCSVGFLLVVARRGLLSSRSAQASRCRGFSCCGARALGHAGSVGVARGLSCSATRGIFPHRGSNPCLLHWHVDSPPLSYQGSPCTCFEKIHTHVCILTHIHTPIC